MKCGLPQQNGEIETKQEQVKLPRDNSQLETSRPETAPQQQQGSANQQQAPEPPKKTAPVRVEKKVGRNEACPCGSGKKFKQCHGKLA